jgi:hypothetical protein
MDYQLDQAPFLTLNPCADIDQPLFEVDEDLILAHVRTLEAPDFACKLTHFKDGQVEITAYPLPLRTSQDIRMGCFDPYSEDRGKKPLRTDEEQLVRDVENKERAVRRAKQQCRLKLKSLGADHLLTFTYRGAMVEPEKIKKDWQEMCRLFHIRYPDWQYLAAPEAHESGGIHLHVGVAGKQDIKWLRRCWLLAIGQHKEDVNGWLNDGVALGEKSLGAVNVQSSQKRYSATGKWKTNKLAAYLTKYLSKEFDVWVKGARHYWVSKSISKPAIERFWLKSKTFHEAVIHCLQLLNSCSTEKDYCTFSKKKMLWFCGAIERDELKNQKIDFSDLLFDHTKKRDVPASTISEQEMAELNACF